MSKIEVLYDHLPYGARVAAANYVALNRARQRWNPRVRELLTLYTQLDRLPYDGRYDQLLRPDVATFTKDKQTLKDNYNSVCCSNRENEVWHTSGTTGSGLRYPVTFEFVNQLWSFYWKFRAIHGVSQEDWFIYFIGKQIVGANRTDPPFWIKSYPTRQILFSQYHLNLRNVKFYLDEILSSRIRCMHGYPSTLSHFAHLIDLAGLREMARSCNFKFISCSSEKLTTNSKKLIEDVFNCRVVQIYGMTEGIANFYECEHGILHSDDYFSKIEFEDVGDGLHRLYGSSFHNEALPLYRYDSGDLVRLSNKSYCPCGRAGHLVEEIYGRQEDNLVLPDGTLVGRIDHIFKTSTAIVESQVYQYADQRVEFRIVPSSHYSEIDEHNLKAEISRKLGRSFSYSIIYVDRVQRTASGKLKAVVSELGKRDEAGC